MYIEETVFNFLIERISTVQTRADILKYKVEELEQEIEQLKREKNERDLQEAESTVSEGGLYKG